MFVGDQNGKSCENSASSLSLSSISLMMHLFVPNLYFYTACQHS
uniref:Uncharacterized protein n=1 Tax=Rhizophora mucronata TaxID=61149 RepID=A0A2P2PKS7_RHIMU